MNYEAGDRVKSLVTGTVGTVISARLPVSREWLGQVLGVKYDGEESITMVSSPLVRLVFPYRAPVTGPEYTPNTNSVDYIVENTYDWRENI